MLITIMEKPYIVEEKFKQLKVIRYKNKLYQIERKKDKWIITMKRGGGRYNNTFKWEMFVEDGKLNIKKKKTFDSIISRGIIMATGVIFMMFLILMLISFFSNTIQGESTDISVIIGMCVCVAIVSICIWYTILTSNQHLEKEVNMFLEEMLKNKEKEGT